MVKLEAKQDSQFLDFTTSLVPEIKNRVSEITDSRQIPIDLIHKMADGGLFRLYVPKSVGGHEVSFVEFLKLVSLIAQADASVAWCFNQNNVLATTSGFMHKSLAEKIWSDPRAILSNGPPISPNAIPVEGGYNLSGRWNFSSGSRHATWALAIAPISGRIGSNGSDSKEMRDMFIPNNEVDWVDTWDVNGLRGTGSFSFTVNDKFVPEENTYVLGGPPVAEGPLYLFSRTLLFCAGFATTALGAARSSIDSLIGDTSTRTPQDQNKLSLQPFTHRELGQAEAIWRSANSYLNEAVEELWDQAINDRKLQEKSRVNLRLASTHAIREAVRVTDIIYNLSGSTAIFESTPIQRKSQDVRAISQQIQGRMAHYDTAGQFFLGLEPEVKLY